MATNESGDASEIGASLRAAIEFALKLADQAGEATAAAFLQQALEVLGVG